MTLEKSANYTSLFLSSHPEAPEGFICCDITCCYSWSSTSFGLFMDSVTKQPSPDDERAPPISSESTNATVASEGVTERQMADASIDANMAIAPEPELKIALEQTLVESVYGDDDEKEEGRKHLRDLSNASSSYVKREGQTRQSGDGQVWNHATGDAVDVKGEPLIFDDDDDGSQKGPVHIKTNGRALRPSHLRLNLSKESTMPWERVDPPLDSDLKAITGYYSPAASQRKSRTGCVVITLQKLQDCKTLV